MSEVFPLLLALEELIEKYRVDGNNRLEIILGHPSDISVAGISVAWGTPAHVLQTVPRQTCWGCWGSSGTSWTERRWRWQGTGPSPVRPFHHSAPLGTVSSGSS